MRIGYSREKYQTCLIFKQTPTDPNRLHQIVWDSTTEQKTDPPNTLIGSLSRLVEQGHQASYGLTVGKVLKSAVW